ncbi:hypothetical protein HYX08_02605 [Candidatus Woesearchaeota archaeon]|nr:hypothetical protein [Candidatus Woesearchaeota archaeon]
MGDPPVTLRQQYGSRPERVPAYLNTNKPVNLRDVQLGDMELLLRDMGQGAKLVTSEIAKGQVDYAKRMSMLREAEFHAMLRNREGTSKSRIYIVIDGKLVSLD